MNKTKNCIILAMIALSIVTIGVANVQASEGLWTGCIDLNRGTFYDFQLGISPLNPCRSNEYTDGFYNKTYIDNLNNQINNLTNQINNLTIFTNQQNVESQRSYNTVYQNSLGKPIFVDVSALCMVGSGETCVIQGIVGSTNPPPGINNTVESGAYHTPSAITTISAISFIVPPGYYYEVTTSTSGSPSLYFDHWTEWS